MHACAHFPKQIDIKTIPIRSYTHPRIEEENDDDDDDDDDDDGEELAWGRGKTRASLFS